MGIVQDIGSGPVCLDTAIFIYFIEEDVRYVDIVAPLFEAIDKGQFQAVTSRITLLETLVVPFRCKDTKLAQQYEQLLSGSKGLTLINLNHELIRKAAFLRATLNIKTPDAFQLAAAQLAECSTFVTNDRRIPKISNLQVLQLSDYV